MEGTNILEQEEKLHKLNSELEERTRQWMRELTLVVNSTVDSESWSSELEISHDKEMDALAQTLYFDDSSSVNSIKKLKTKKHNTKVRKKGMVSESIPETARGLSSESSIKFLRAKVSLLQNQLITLRHQLTTTAEDLQKSETELKHQDDEKLRNNQELIIIREKCRRQEQTIIDLTDKNNIKNKEYNILKKEIDCMKRDVKKAMATAIAYELKLNKAKDENERLKMNLKLSQNGEKEARDGGRAKNEELTQSVRKLEKQKSELISAFKKQLSLIENLKKQRTFNQAKDILKQVDDEFLKLLDWSSPPNMQ